MNPSPSFNDLKNSLAAGNFTGPAAVIYERFVNRLVSLAAKNVGERLGRKVDAEDIAHTAFRTFFRHLDAGHYQLTDWASLWCLLRQIALCRVFREAEKLATARRDPTREISPEVAAETFNREPKPEEVVFAEDLHKRFFAKMPEKYHPALDLRLEGHTQEEIARRTGMSIATVERILRRAREALMELLAEESG